MLLSEKERQTDRETDIQRGGEEGVAKEGGCIENGWLARRASCGRNMRTATSGQVREAGASPSMVGWLLRGWERGRIPAGLLINHSSSSSSFAASSSTFLFSLPLTPFSSFSLHSLWSALYVISSMESIDHFAILKNFISVNGCRLKSWLNKIINKVSFNWNEENTRESIERSSFSFYFDLCIACRVTILKLSAVWLLQSL